MWQEDVTLPSYPKLTHSLKVDVAIVGAGITGLTAAYLLRESGMSVVVLEKETIGSGATGYTTGFLTQVIDTDLCDAESIWGIETSGKILEGHKAAIDTIEKIVKEEKIDCEFVRCPNFIYSTKSKEELIGEYEAAKRLGLPVALDTDDNIGSDVQGFIEVKNQAKIHPLKYIKGLAECITQSGVRIFEHTPVHDAEEGHLLYTTDALVEAKHILLATHKPLWQPAGLFFKKGTYVTHVFALEIPDTPIPEGIFEDTRNPYHYFRSDHLGKKTRIIVGGEDHRRDIPVPDRQCERALEEFVEKTFGHLSYKITKRWKGPILEPSDGLPIIGPYEHDSTFYASGFSRTGLTYGTLAALMFADHVLERDNPWKEIFNARRFPYAKGLIVKGRDYLEILVHGALRNLLRISALRPKKFPIRFFKERFSFLSRDVLHEKIDFLFNSLIALFRLGRTHVQKYRKTRNLPDELKKL